MAMFRLLLPAPASPSRPPILRANSEVCRTSSQITSPVFASSAWITSLGFGMYITPSYTSGVAV